MGHGVGLADCAGFVSSPHPHPNPEPNPSPKPHQANKDKIKPRKTIKIGRPGYRITKQMDPESEQRSLLFEVDYPEIEEGLQPRHRFMSAYEQRVEAPEKEWQYLLFAAEPYETIGFKMQP